MIIISKFGDIVGYTFFHLRHPLRQTIGRYYTLMNNLESYAGSDSLAYPEPFEHVSFWEYKLMRRQRLKPAASESGF